MLFFLPHFASLIINLYICHKLKPMAKRTNPFKPIINQIPLPLRNRYVVSLLLLFIWMSFFDKHDFYTQWKLQGTLNNLKEDKIRFKENIKQIETDRKDIEQDKEKFAREHYYMHKKNESVYILVEE